MKKFFPILTLSLLITLYILTFGYLSIARHWSFQTAKFDIGINHQALWSTLHGHPFHLTEGSSLAYHFTPIYFFLAPFLLIWDKAETLLALQTIIFALGAIPLFLIARDILKNDLLALAFPLAYLLSPALQAANLADFQAAPLAVPFSLFACYFALRRQAPLFLTFAILAMLTREDMFYLALLLGAYSLFKWSRRMGIFLITLSLIYAVCAFGFIIPKYAKQAFGENYLFIARYRHFQGLREAIGLILSRGPRYAAFLLAHFGFLSLLAPEILIWSTPFFLLNVLSNYPATYSGEQHYSAIFLPFLTLSAILGVAKLKGKARPVLLAWMIALSLALHFLRGFTPLSWNFPLPSIPPHYRLLSQFTSLIPRNAPLATTVGLYPHLSNRLELYPLPSTGNANYVLLDVTSITDMHPVDFYKKFRELMENGFGIVKASDGYILLSKGEGKRELPDEFFDFARAVNPQPSYPIEVNFEGKLLFKGLDLIRFKEGKLLFVRTYWQPLAPLPENLEIKLFILNEDGEPFAGTPFHPLPTLIWYPPHRWKAGETVKVDTIPWDLGQYFVVALKVSAGEDWRVRDFKASGPIVLLYEDTLVQVAAFRRSSTFLCQLTLPERCPYEPTGTGDLSPEWPAEADFGGVIALKGYDLKPGKPLRLTLYWQALGPIPEDYSVFIHVLDEEGRKITQNDGPPFWLTKMGTTSWVIGRIYRDERVLEAPGDWDKLEIGLYRWQDLTRLPFGEQGAFIIKRAQEDKNP